MSNIYQKSILTDKDIPALLPRRYKNGHKGSYGRVALICGSAAYPGAALLSVEAALRSGVGYTTLFAPKEVRELVLVRTPECVTYPIECLYQTDLLTTPLAEADAIVFGPGVGQEKQTEDLLFSLLQSSLKMPILIDADGINLLAKHPDKCKELFTKQTKNIVFTPHPLEFTRLFGGDMNELLSNRESFVLDAAKSFFATVLLKGHRTLVATKNGELWENPTGGAGLSKAGSGDVLSGLIGGFLAQGMETVAATTLAAYLHGKAADTLEQTLSPLGVTPSDLPLQIAKLLSEFTSFSCI